MPPSAVRPFTDPQAPTSDLSLRIVLIVFTVIATTIMMVPAVELPPRNGRPDLAVGIVAWATCVVCSCLRIGRPRPVGALARRIDLAAVVPYVLAIVLPCIASSTSGPWPSMVAAILDGAAVGCGFSCFVLVLIASGIDRARRPG